MPSCPKPQGIIDSLISYIKLINLHFVAIHVYGFHWVCSNFFFYHFQIFYCTISVKSYMIAHTQKYSIQISRTLSYFKRTIWNRSIESSLETSQNSRKDLLSMSTFSLQPEMQMLSYPLEISIRNLWFHLLKDAKLPTVLVQISARIKLDHHRLRVLKHDHFFKHIVS